MTKTKTASTPVVTVITPVYNGEPYLAETIASIQAQTFEDFEHIIVDDCSTDSTGQIAQEAIARDLRLSYLCAPANFGGPAGPRNLGIARARGRYIAFCDADDLWAHDKLERQVAVMQSSDAEIVSTRIANFQDGETPPDPAASNLETRLTPITLRQMLVKNRIALSSVMISRAALDRVGPFDEAKDHVAVEDYDMWMRVLHSSDRPARRIDLPLVHYRRIGTSISANKWKMLRKAMHMQRKVFARDGQEWLFWVRLPWALARYIVTALWTRKFSSGL